MRILTFAAGFVAGNVWSSLAPEKRLNLIARATEALDAVRPHLEPFIGTLKAGLLEAKQGGKDLK